MCFDFMINKSIMILMGIHTVHLGYKLQNTHLLAKNTWCYSQASNGILACQGIKELLCTFDSLTNVLILL